MVAQSWTARRRCGTCSMEHGRGMTVVGDLFKCMVDGHCLLFNCGNCTISCVGRRRVVSPFQRSSPAPGSYPRQRYAQQQRGSRCALLWPPQRQCTGSVVVFVVGSGSRAGVRVCTRIHEPTAGRNRIFRCGRPAATSTAAGGSAHTYTNAHQPRSNSHSYNSGCAYPRDPLSVSPPPQQRQRWRWRGSSRRTQRGCWSR